MRKLMMIALACSCLTNPPAPAGPSPTGVGPLEALEADGRFDRIAAWIRVHDLEEPFSARGPTTAFLPTDAALESVALPAAKSAARALLERHLAPGALDRATLRTRLRIDLLGGGDVPVDVGPEEGLRVGGRRLLDGTRRYADGLVHPVDGLLRPSSKPLPPRAPLIDLDGRTRVDSGAVERR